MLALPKMSLLGVTDYVLVGAGLVIGITIFAPPMMQLENGFRRK